MTFIQVHYVTVAVSAPLLQTACFYNPSCYQTLSQGHSM